MLAAHGGLDRWRAARRIRARVRTGGLLVRTRMPGNRLADYEIAVEVGEPVATATPFPRPGQRAVFDHGAVRIESDGGEVVAARADPRREFFGRAGLRRNLRWDPLDATYFAGYAMWNYLTTPYLLTREGVEVSEGEAWTDGGVRLRPLEACFPPELDTHSPRQTFHFDQAGLLRRLDYTAQVVGGWARAVHRCAAHVESGGLVLPTSRRVTPLGAGRRALPGPVLVSLELSGIEVEGADPGPDRLSP